MLFHLRWDFVFQRPQHLLTRAAKSYRVLFVEEPVFEREMRASWQISEREGGIVVAVPHLPSGLTPSETLFLQRSLLTRLMSTEGQPAKVAWYYSPMAVAFTSNFQAEVTVYDCMDELSAFRGAPPEMTENERLLFARADLVFTGGQSLYEAKVGKHQNLHAFPSSIDTAHYAAARSPERRDPVDQAQIPHPRLGFFGVIDERMDVELVGKLASLRPDWQFVMIGPVVKIDPASLPRPANIRWLGGKTYDQLPSYVGGWDVGLMPFAHNESTRFISPTKTPEFLASGIPVVSTSITDVVRPYGEAGLVEIADSPEDTIAKAELLMTRDRQPWLEKVDRHLANTSWNKTWRSMQSLIERASQSKTSLAVAPASSATRNKGPLVYDWLVVGAGFAGSVIAERLASQRNEKVLVIDRRPHVGGNAYDVKNDAGLLIHQYGPHIFHTNSASVFDHLSKFTDWRPYEHKVLAAVDGKLLPIPINLDTINSLYGLNLTSEELEGFFASKAEPVDEIRTSEDVVVSRVGRELYEKFFRGYTRKQWGVDPSELDKSVTARVPTRTNRDDRYFSDTYQYMPKQGYTRMFESMLRHPNIEVRLGVDFADLKDIVPHRRIVFTGPIDEYFDYRFGKLPYRSLRFEHVTLNEEWHQSVAVVNYPQTEEYTRITEYKYLTGEESSQTSLTYEYPSAVGDPYYPIPRPENAELYKRYEKLALQTNDVWFIGRLATYKYYNMDQVVGQALAAFKRISDTVPVETLGGNRDVRKLTGESAAQPTAAAMLPST